MTLRIHWIVHFKQMNYISVWVTSWDKRNPEYAKHWRQSTRDEKRPKQKNWNEKQLIQENFLEKKKIEIVLGNKVLHTECNDPRMTSTKLQQKKKKMKEFVAGVGWGEKFRHLGQNIKWLQRERQLNYYSSLLVMKQSFMTEENHITCVKVSWEDVNQYF